MFAVRKTGAPTRQEQKNHMEEKKRGGGGTAGFHSLSAYLYIDWSQTQPWGPEWYPLKSRKGTTEEQREGCEVLLCSAAWRKMKTWWWRMTFGQRHTKLAQLCEDKGKACDGLQPSSSIWVLSSLGPGGTWEHTSHGGRPWLYCPLMARDMQCCRRPVAACDDLWVRFHNQWK